MFSQKFLLHSQKLMTQSFHVKEWRGMCIGLVVYGLDYVRSHLYI